MKAETKKAVEECLGDFLSTWNEIEHKEIWSKQSSVFHKFWNEKMMNANVETLSEEEMIPIIQILDARGKGVNGRREYQGAAYSGIYQSVWYEVFRGLKANPDTLALVNKILTISSDAERIPLLNELYEKSSVQALTGDSAIVINDFLFAYDPEHNNSALSLADRIKAIDYFGTGDVRAINASGWGERIISTKHCLIAIIDLLPQKLSVRALSWFLYSDCIRKLWKQTITTTQLEGQTTVTSENPFEDLRTHDHVVGEPINFRGMNFAPAEENGVVFLFSKITEDLGITVVSIQKGFPDAECIKWNQEDGRGRRIYIEFEYNTAKFKDHLEDMKNGKPCDYVVCWEHDWKDMEKYSKVKIVCLKDLIKQLPKDVS